MMSKERRHAGAQARKARSLADSFFSCAWNISNTSFDYFKYSFIVTFFDQHILFINLIETYVLMYS